MNLLNKAKSFSKGTKYFDRKHQKCYKVFGLDNAAWLIVQANDGKEHFTQRNYPGTYTHDYDGVFVGQMENFIVPVGRCVRHFQFRK
ncbi:hypothetical protein LEP1GSC187_1478 [Leptospira santarosai str. ZUN179]|uniref:Uncharacterized protein n=1 Tax=Leptospira santarosai str. ZUN179 TaxID=1049985 RepID=M6V877_9LEPT|nr:hypothetical protein LEP1GSC187_1478 [Leptospira santarosai str. ZUN179]